MKAIITNKLVLLNKPTNEIRSSLMRLLSFKDKSKQFSLNRIKKNPYVKKEVIQKLQKEVYCKAFNELPNGDLVFSSGLSHYLPSGIEIEDRRCSTGETISLPWKDKPFNPRPYQEEALDLMDSNWRGTICLAVGLGKTLTAIHCIRRHKKRSLIIVPSESIAKQFLSDLQDAFGEGRVAMYGGGKKKTADITVAIAASVTRNTEVFKKLDLGLVIIDEAHHTPSTTFLYVAKELGDVGKVFGLTGTDFRADGKDILIEAACSKTIINRDILWGIQNGWLAKPEFIVREVESDGHDYNDKLKSYKQHVLKNTILKTQIYNDIMDAITNKESFLCLVAETEHGEELSKMLGVPFAQGSDKKSQEYVDQLNRGLIPGLVGTGGKIGEGSNTKNVDSLFLANFMASRGIVIQSMGRGLRKTETKDSCKIYDYMLKGSSILTRHCKSRIKLYKEITNDVTVVKIEKNNKPNLKL